MKNILLLLPLLLLSFLPFSLGNSVGDACVEYVSPFGYMNITFINERDYNICWRIIPQSPNPSRNYQSLNITFGPNFLVNGFYRFAIFSGSYAFPYKQIGMWNGTDLANRTFVINDPAALFVITVPDSSGDNDYGNRRFVCSWKVSPVTYLNHSLVMFFAQLCFLLIPAIVMMAIYLPCVSVSRERESERKKRQYILFAIGISIGVFAFGLLIGLGISRTPSYS
eukprot:TRINITY_DN11839_c0_g1_i1.p1 TRINITY_DN11839_c0_g1~~TRINITY_DN11839_c0_g1_i1.p1  ORF type:complete len:224 (-),score=32.35 TRINITY_DN11839_c0_g1_i1:36-707(-)